MLGKFTVITTIAVHDMQNAIEFYRDILGLKAVGHNKGGYLFESTGGTIGLYESGSAGTSQATCAWWKVDDVEATVKELEAQGIIFETNYDLPYAKRKGDVYLLGKDEKAAWFRDPDGNILGIGNF